MNFNTQLLHGKSVGAYSFGATLPSISQVSAYTYETSEQLEKVCQNKAAGFAYIESEIRQWQLSSAVSVRWKEVFLQRPAHPV